jgi:hypothetical protein
VEFQTIETYQVRNWFKPKSEKQSAEAILDTSLKSGIHFQAFAFTQRHLYRYVVAFHAAPARGEREMARSAYILEAESTATMHAWVTALSEVIAETRQAAAGEGGGGGGGGAAVVTVGAVQVEYSVTHSLQPPGFNPFEHMK